MLILLTQPTRSLTAAMMAPTESDTFFSLPPVIIVGYLPAWRGGGRGGGGEGGSNDEGWLPLLLQDGDFQGRQAVLISTGTRDSLQYDWKRV